MSESNKPFTVKDRRHFTPEGRVREDPEPPDAPEDSAPESPPDPPTVEDAPERSAPPTEPPEEGPPSPPPAGGEADRESPSEPRADAPGAQDAGPADFSQFLFSLGAQAGMFLSGQGLPEGTDAGEALAGARSIISILEMLRDKTEGRRTPREDEVLESLLYELRMAYVERSRAGGS
jgi:hypothetical protein